MLQERSVPRIREVVGYEHGDIDFDNDVDLADFQRFLEVYPGAAAAASGVPEPSSVGLSLCVLAGIAAVARRRSHRVHNKIERRLP